MSIVYIGLSIKILHDFFGRKGALIGLFPTNNDKSIGDRTEAETGRVRVKNLGNKTNKYVGV